MKFSKTSPIRRNLTNLERHAHGTEHPWRLPQRLPQGQATPILDDRLIADIEHLSDADDPLGDPHVQNSLIHVRSVHLHNEHRSHGVAPCCA